MNTLDEIQLKGDIVSLVSRYANISTKGSRPKVNCPFHSEKTPSFVLYPESNTWYCFGACATGGTIVNFVMKKENLQFSEAVKYSADLFGIKIQHYSKQQKQEAYQITEINELAEKWYSSILEKSDVAQKAREYLQARGISQEVRKRRGIGFSTPTNFSLFSHLTNQNIPKNRLEETKLFYQDKTVSGNYREFFANRVTFSIKNSNEQVIGFGARTLGDELPKYINSPASKVFNKASVLYGLNWAQDSIKQAATVVIMEGYIDVITAHESGFTNTVGIMGVAVSDSQIIYLAKLMPIDRPSKIIFCLDADSAGQSATISALKMASEVINRNFRQRNITLAIATIDYAKDPDEIIRTNRQQWQNIINNPLSLIDFTIKVFTQNCTTDQQKNTAIQNLRPFIFAIKNDLEREKVIVRIAKTLEIETALLKLTIRSHNSNQQRKNIKATNAFSLSFGKIDPAEVEKHLLSMIFKYKSLREFGLNVDSNVLTDEINCILMEIWKQCPEKIENKNIEDILKERYAEIIQKKQGSDSEDSGEIINTAKRYYKIISIRHSRKSYKRTSNEYWQAVSSGDDEIKTCLHNKMLSDEKRIKTILQK